MSFRDPKQASDAARNPNTPPSELAVLSQSEFGFVREYIANNPNTTSEVLEALIPIDLKSEVNRHIANALARNAHSASGILSEILAMLDFKDLDGSRRENWPYENLIIDVLSHPNLGEADANAVLSSVHLSKRIKLSLVGKNPPLSILTLLSEDKSSTIRDLARKHLSLSSEF